MFSNSFQLNNGLDSEDEKLTKINQSVKQHFIFNENELNLIECYVNDVIEKAERGYFKKCTVDKAPLRNKYFFGERYTYGSQMHRKGPGMERLYPEGSVDPIPAWAYETLIKRLVDANIVPENFINCVAINDYLPGGCIVSHIDPPHIFDRPIVSLSLFSDSALCFGCKFGFKPIRTTRPIKRLELPRGVVTVISGFAANEVTHCIRPQDVPSRRAVIMLRRVFPFAPRFSIESKMPLTSDITSYNDPLMVLNSLSEKMFKEFYKNYSKNYKRRSTFGGIMKPYYFKRSIGNMN